MNSKESEITENIKKRSSWWIYPILLLLSVLVFFGLVSFVVPAVLEMPMVYKIDTPVTEEITTNMPSHEELQAEIGRLEKKLNNLTPGGVYLVVNTSDNKFDLYKSKKIIRSGLCSTGSYVKLELNSEKSWVFETPKGVFTIKGKITDPVWRKPDWAFVEEGLPIPAADDPSRYEYGVLGDYALSLGGGYLIHGTLYQRFLGQSVTHGCIRMNDDDLKTVYETLPVGAKVYIY